MGWCEGRALDAARYDNLLYVRAAQLLQRFAGMGELYDNMRMIADAFAVALRRTNRAVVKVKSVAVQKASAEKDE